jgi:hypothetical protein
MTVHLIGALTITYLYTCTHAPPGRSRLHSWPAHMHMLVYQHDDETVHII